MIVLCTYSLQASRTVDMLDVARASMLHRASARQLGISGDAQTQAGQTGNQEAKWRALDVLSEPFSGHETLTPKERVALAQIIRGASSEEAGRTLGISPRSSISIDPIC
jgi:hypothetical protein